MQPISNRSENTKRNHLRWFSKFCGLLEMNPDQALELREKEVESGDRKARHAMEKRLLSFVERLKREGFSSGGVKMGYTAVRSFFDRHYLRLGMRRSDAPRGDPLGKKKSRRTVEQPDKETGTLIGKDLRNGWTQICRPCLARTSKNNYLLNSEVSLSRLGFRASPSL